MARDLVAERGREGLAAQRQMPQRGMRRSAADDRVQVGRHAAYEGDLVPHHLLPELRGRFPDGIADDDRRPAADQRQQGLLDRSVEAA